MRISGLLVVLSLAVSACGESQQELESGRYRIQASEHGTLLLDTATGKTWVQVYAEDRRDQAPYWEPSARLDDRAEWQAYDALHPHQSETAE